jgi:signal transduction histidine kinase
MADINVIDNGPGIPDSVKSHVFARSSQSIAGGSGKGLGLYIVRMLIDRYGGKIKVKDRVENDPSQGLVMNLTLKAAPDT